MRLSKTAFIFIIIFFFILYAHNAFASFSFGAAGDHGDSNNANTNASFTILGASATINDIAFYLALGDMNYGAAGSEPGWCTYIKSKIGQSFPFQILSGNHEDDARVNGYIGNFASCLPDRLNSSGTYSAQYYFDYQNLARIIMISPALSIGGASYQYTLNSVNYNWLVSAIDGARAAGIPWVIVGTHKNCITMGVKPSCEIGKGLMDLLIAKKVDLILQGHDHDYQRSKQLSCVTVDSYNSSCVADDGSDNAYEKGKGPVIVIDGAFGFSAYNVNTNDTEAQYFAKWMGNNSNLTWGYMKYTVSDTQIQAHYVRTGGGNFSDDFVIQAPVAVPIDTDPPIITGVASTQISQTSAVMVWQTQEPSTSSAAYGATVGYGNIAESSSLAQDHSILISGLAPGIFYNYQVSSIDAQGNRAQSGNYTFTTKSLPLDTDGDGILDENDSDDDNDLVADSIEVQIGTNPLQADSDSDGYSDNEDAFPLNSAEWLDTDYDSMGDNADIDDDNDGIIDSQEVILGTNPKKADSDDDEWSDFVDFYPLEASMHESPGPNADFDNDGLSDASEGALGTDPRNADTDGDGVKDGADLFPVNPNETLNSDGDSIGNNADTDDDNDGLSDEEESRLGTNPLKSDSDNDGVSDKDDAYPMDGTKSESPAVQEDRAPVRGVISGGGGGGQYAPPAKLSPGHAIPSDKNPGTTGSQAQNTQTPTPQGEADLAFTDTDGDTLSDYDEYIYGTDNNNVDTDNDGHDDANEVRTGHDPLNPPGKNSQALANKLKGKIILQIQRKGEAYYIHPFTGQRYYLRNGDMAYQIMRKLSFGITDKDLAKIPIAKDSPPPSISLPTQSRGRPQGAREDRALMNRLKGRILLQVQRHGEAWYVNPVDGKRYYLKDGQTAYDIMRKLGLGVANSSIIQIPYSRL